MPYYRFFTKKSRKDTRDSETHSHIEMVPQILNQTSSSVSIERFFPFGGARLVSIFHFVPNSEALGACSLTSKLTIGHDSQSLEVVEELQAPRASVIDLLLPLLLAAIQEVAMAFSCPCA